MKLAIEAAQALSGPKLVVTGKKGWGEELAGPAVHATGYVDENDLCALYSGASLYLAPSFHEGFGIPIIEAFACGCPVICSTGGAMPEVAGEAAVIEPSWEPEHWANMIRSTLGDSGKLADLRERGFERVKRFDWHRLAQETNEVYREVVG